VTHAFEVFHFAGHFDADGTQMVRAIRKTVRQPSLPVRRFPWAFLVVASPFVALFREISEMRYLWREPIRLDNARLVAALGSEPHTPLDRAVAATLESLGCLPASAPTGQRPE
jgi:nucleoside-diphosphate-sugar epimerase